MHHILAFASCWIKS